MVSLVLYSAFDINKWPKRKGEKNLESTYVQYLKTEPDIETLRPLNHDSTALNYSNQDKTAKATQKKKRIVVKWG